MTIQALRKAYHAKPFIPFSISLADGRQIHVPSQECVMIGPQASRTFGVALPGEDYAIVDLLLVTSLDFTRVKTNGRSRRRSSS